MQIQVVTNGRHEARPVASRTISAFSSCRSRPSAACGVTLRVRASPAAVTTGDRSTTSKAAGSFERAVPPIALPFSAAVCSRSRSARAALAACATQSRNPAIQAVPKRVARRLRSVSGASQNGSPQASGMDKPPNRPGTACKESAEAGARSGRVLSSRIGSSRPPRRPDHASRATRWVTPDGQTIMGPLPDGTQGHFGPNLRRFALMQYHQGQSTLPRLTALLQSVGLSISEREIQRLLTEKQDGFLDETRDVLRAGLRTTDIALDIGG